MSNQVPDEMHHYWYTGQATIVAPISRAGTVSTSLPRLAAPCCIRNRSLLDDCDPTKG